jgi:glycosyltransferase involved in cell wall biosynthesis
MSWTGYANESWNYSPAPVENGDRGSLNVFLVAPNPGSGSGRNKGRIRISGSSTDTVVAICICTFRRPAGLRRLLACLASQTFSDVPHPRMAVIVVDNEGSRENRQICREYRIPAFESLTYVVEQQQGISYARNACIDNLPDRTRFVAMVDDDESPDSAWLNHLLLAQYSSGADVVVGPTVPEFEENTASWIQETGYFAKPHNPQPRAMY